MAPASKTLDRLATVCLVLNIATALASVIGTWFLLYTTRAPELPYDKWAVGLAEFHVATGFFAAILHLGRHQGWRGGAVLLASAIVVAGGMEFLGTTTGLPFGRYVYSERLGPRLFGRVPFVMPFTWFTMLYPALEIAHRLRAPRWLRVLAAAAVFTLWDLALDPSATAAFACWAWLDHGAYYGMPLRNLAGWLATAGTVAAIQIYFAPAWRPSRSRFPLAIYLGYSGFSAALAAVVGRPGATAIWLAGVGAIFGLLRWRWIESAEVGQSLRAA